MIITNPEISRSFFISLIFFGNVFSSILTKHPLLEEHEYVAPVPNMTENYLTITMKFEETNFLIMFFNPTIAAKIVVSMAPSSWWYDKP